MEWIKTEFACREPGTNRLRDNNGGILLRYCIKCPALKIGRCLRADPDKIKSDLAAAIAEQSRDQGAGPRKRQDREPCRRCHKQPKAENHAWCRSCIEKGRRDKRKSRARSRAKPQRLCAWPGCETKVREGLHCRSHAAAIREHMHKTARLLEQAKE